MNIFILDEDMDKCVQYHCDKHVVKMILEYAQILCSVHHLSGGTAPYRLTHKNHPCNVWARESLSNYDWLLLLAHKLAHEYTHRYGKVHKSSLVINSLPVPNIPDIGLTPFPQAMPDEYKSSDAVAAYRSYYLGEKSWMLQYKNRPQPDWIV
jgi:hypothetical protein